MFKTEQIPALALLAVVGLLGVGQVLAYVVHLIRKRGKPESKIRGPWQAWIWFLTHWPCLTLLLGLALPLGLSAAGVLAGIPQVNLDFGTYLNVELPIQYLQDVTETVAVEQGTKYHRRRRSDKFKDYKFGTTPGTRRLNASLPAEADVFDLEEFDMDADELPDPWETFSRQLTSTSVRTQSVHNWKIEFFYQAKDSEKGIFTKEALEEIRDFENELRNIGDYSSFCRMRLEEGKCDPAYTVTNVFFSVPDATQTSGDTMSVVYDGSGGLTDIDSVLEGWARDGVKWWTDKDFSATNRKSQYTRASFYGGMPLPGYSGINDRAGEQNSKIKAYLTGIYDNFLSKADSTGADGLPYKHVAFTWVEFKYMQSHEIMWLLIRDCAYAAGTVLVVSGLVLLKEQNIFIGIMGGVSTLSAFTTTYYFHYVVMGYTRLSVLDFVSLFLIIGVAADDFILLFDQYQQSIAFVDKSPDPAQAHRYPGKRMAWAYQRAASGMLVTSVTTCGSFYSNMFSIVTVVRQFGFFMGTLVLWNFINVLIIFPAAILVSERYIMPWWPSCLSPPFFCFNGMKSVRDQSMEDHAQEVTMDSIGAGDGHETNYSNNPSNEMRMRRAQKKRDKAKEMKKARAEMDFTDMKNRGFGLAERIMANYVFPFIYFGRFILPFICLVTSASFFYLAYAGFTVASGELELYPETLNLGRLNKLRKEIFPATSGSDLQTALNYNPPAGSVTVPSCPKGGANNTFCNGLGKCNTKTGKCSCQDGYVGMGCSATQTTGTLKVLYDPRPYVHVLASPLYDGLPASAPAFKRDILLRNEGDTEVDFSLTVPGGNSNWLQIPIQQGVVPERSFNRLDNTIPGNSLLSAELALGGKSAPFSQDVVVTVASSTPGIDLQEVSLGARLLQPPALRNLSVLPSTILPPSTTAVVTPLPFDVADGFFQSDPAANLLDKDMLLPRANYDVTLPYEVESVRLQIEPLPSVSKVMVGDELMTSPGLSAPIRIATKPLSTVIKVRAFSPASNSLLVTYQLEVSRICSTDCDTTTTTTGPTISLVADLQVLLPACDAFKSNDDAITDVQSGIAKSAGVESSWVTIQEVQCLSRRLSERHLQASSPARIKYAIEVPLQSSSIDSDTVMQNIGAVTADEMTTNIQNALSAGFSGMTCTVTDVGPASVATTSTTFTFTTTASTMTVSTTSSVTETSTTSLPSCSAHTCGPGWTTMSANANTGCTTTMCTDEECCDRVTCRGFSCGDGLIDKPSMSSINCTADTCTDVECCDSVTCSSHSCGDGWIDKSDKSGINCPSDACTDADCCNRATCNDFLCDDGWTAKSGASSINCAADNCTESECCDRVTCSGYTCGDGLTEKADMSSINCALDTCNNTECCDGVTCSGHLCGAGLIDRSGKSSIACAADTCTDTECCDNMTCNGYSCGDGLTNKQELSSINCASDVCTNNECCNQVTCTGYSCGAGLAEKSGLSGINCALDTCIDAECCDSVTCSEHSCGDGLTEKSGMAGISCAADTCLDAECCNNVTCGGHSCGAGLSEKPEMALINCALDTCTDTDCCDTVTCRGYMCGDGLVNKSDMSGISCAMDTCTDIECCSQVTCNGYSCGDGLTDKSEMSSINCSLDVCTNVECCDNVTCTAYSCGAGLLDKTGKSSINCALDTCTDTECCDQTDCGNYVCGDGWSDKTGKSSIICGSGCFDAECCDQVTCSGFSCGDGLLEKSGMSSIACAADTCADTECCDKATCNGYSCGDGLTNKPEMSNINCTADTCTDGECCDQVTCSGYFCGDGLANKSEMSSIPCTLDTCSNADCCDQVTCSGYACGGGFGDKAGMSNINCALDTCTDAECCNRVQCSIYTCGDGLTDKSGKSSIACSPSCSDTICCDQVTCSGYSCGEGLSDKTGLSNINCSADTCTNAECCDQVTCSGYSCGDGLVDKSGMTSINCAADTCADAECCDQVTCSEDVCGDGWANKLNLGSINCTLDTCTEAECCDPVTCSGFSCGSGWVDKSGMSGINCAADVCLVTECCDQITCDGYSCGDGWTNKSGMSSINCAADTCTNVECCNQVTCSGHTCSAGWKEKTDLASTTCSTDTCTDVECCDRVTCSGYTCGNGLADKSGKSSINCAADTCTDGECCDQVTCGGYTCGAGLTDKSGMTSINCTSDTCTDLECCDQVTCAGYSCGDGLIEKAGMSSVNCAADTCVDTDCCEQVTCSTHSCGSGLVDKSGSSSIHCALDTCNDTECCEQATCSGHTCGDGLVDKASMGSITCSSACTDTDCCDQVTCDGSYDCGAGLTQKSGMASVSCALDTCADSDCCDQVTCTGYSCPNGWADRPSLASINCADDTCTDDECCDEACPAYSNSDECPTARCVWSSGECEDGTCNIPSSIGYNFASAGGTTTMAGFAPNGVTCDSGYSGSVTYTVCSSPGDDYSVNGCEAACSVPSTTGYDFTAAAGTLTVSGFSPSGVSCANGFSGAVSYTVCSGGAGSTYQVSGCVGQCTVPSTAGYDFSSAGGTLSLEGFAPSGVICASGYAGSVSYTACTVGGAEYSVAGCGAECTVPSTPGYDFSGSGGTLTRSGFDPNGVVCDANGYTGTVSYTVCPSAGTSYAVSGCEEQCTVPSTLGYDFSSAGGTLTTSGFAPTGVVCASGYQGSVDYTACGSAGGAYSVAGCVAACNVPSTAGFDFSGQGGTVTILGFSPSGVLCATGYAGTVTYSPCSVAGTAYTVAGCEAACSVPSRTGYDFSSAGGNVMISGFAPTGIICASGYEGSVVPSPCGFAGAVYSVAGCQPACSVPSTTGYDVSSAGGTLTISGFAANGVSCASGYSGTVTYTACTSAGDAYSVSGCKAACSVPASTGFDFSSAGGTLTIDGFAPSGVKCAVGYTGAVSYSACGSAGAEYSVSGCEEAEVVSGSLDLDLGSNQCSAFISDSNSEGHIRSALAQSLNVSIDEVAATLDCAFGDSSNSVRVNYQVTATQSRRLRRRLSSSVGDITSILKGSDFAADFSSALNTETSGSLSVSVSAVDVITTTTSTATTTGTSSTQTATITTSSKTSTVTVTSVTSTTTVTVTDTATTTTSGTFTNTQSSTTTVTGTTSAPPTTSSVTSSTGTTLTRTSTHTTATSSSTSSISMTSSSTSTLTVSSTSSTTGTTTSTTVPPGNNLVSGSISLNVSDCAALDTDAARIGIANGIAAAASVQAAYVTVSVRSCASGRRLTSGDAEILYDIDIPDDAGMTGIAAKLNLLAESKVTLSEKLNAALVAADVSGLELAVTALTDPGITERTTTTTTTVFCPGDPPCGGLLYGECKRSLNDPDPLVHWRCQCTETYNGSACTERVCPTCRNSGTCVKGDQTNTSVWGCDCPEGFAGNRCQDRVCPGNCSDAGDCNTILGTCDCFPGHAGADCSQVPPKMVPLTNCIEVGLVWGLKGYQADDTTSPEYDPSFDFYAEETQKWIQETCTMLRNDDSFQLRQETPCWIDLFAEFITQLGGQYPMPDREKASEALQVFMHTTLTFGGIRFGPTTFERELTTDGEDYSGNLRYIRMRMKVNLAANGNKTEKAAMKKRWEDFAAKRNSEAPGSVGNMLMISYTFTEIELESQVLGSTMAAFVGSMGITAVAVAFFTQNIIIAIYVAGNILLVVGVLAGFLLGILQYEFGVVEAIGATIFVGMSVDYTLHMAHSYNEAYPKRLEEEAAGTGCCSAQKRLVCKKKTEYSVVCYGPSILGGAATTAGGTVFLLPCRMILFQKLGWTLLSNALISVVFAFIFLAPLLSWAGPTGNAGNIFCGYWGHHGDEEGGDEDEDPGMRGRSGSGHEEEDGPGGSADASDAVDTHSEITAAV